MAWLRIYQSLRDHRKLFDAADELEISPPHMMGLLISFWLWALDNAPTGKLDGITPRMISRAAQWEGPPERLSGALIRAGWLDEHADGTLEIHDWIEYAGKLIDQRQNEKERSKRRRETEKEPTNDRRSTAGQPSDDREKTGGRLEKSRVDKINIYNPPIPPSDEGSDAAKESPIITRFNEFWSAYPKKVGKQYALKAWNKIKPTAELHERIMQALTDQKRSVQWVRENGRFIPNPATWLNGGYWDNEEVSNDAGPGRHIEQPEAPATERDWIKGFKPADDDLDE